MKNIHTLIKNSETRLFKAVFPNTTNHYGTLFGGTALQLMDEVSFICATRFSRKKVVTVSSDKVDFAKSIPEGTIVELVASIKSVGKTSCVVMLTYLWKRCTVQARKSCKRIFTFVAINDQKKPIPIIDL